MTLQVVSSSLIPIYNQIHKRFQQQILSPLLKPGDILPSEQCICIKTGASRMTTHLTLSQITTDGLVVRKRGRGTYVIASNLTFEDFNSPMVSYTRMVAQRGLTVKSQILFQRAALAAAPIAEKLKLVVGESVVQIERLLGIKGEVLSPESLIYSHTRFPALAEHDLTDCSIYAALSEL